MPGFLYHLACADIVAHHPETWFLGERYDDFLVGNLLPDLTVDKNQSHFRRRSESGWLVPDLDAAHDAMWPLSEDPTYFGVFCHLELDRVFIEEVLGKKYLLSGRAVLNRKDRSTWGVVEDFLSKEYGIYADYSAYNLRLIADGLVPLRKLFSLPRSLEPSLFAELGWQPSSRDWRSEIESYLAEPTEDPLGFFTYEEIVRAILRAANRVIYLHHRDRHEYEHLGPLLTKRGPHPYVSTYEKPG